MLRIAAVVTGQADLHDYQADHCVQESVDRDRAPADYGGERN